MPRSAIKTDTGEVRGPSGRAWTLRFEPGGEPGGGPPAAGSYVAALEELPPGRYRADVRAAVGGRAAGRAGCEFAVDRWSLELARSLPDSAALAAVAAATGGRVADAAGVERWARALPARPPGRGRVVSYRLWESPAPYALILALLGVEWLWRRRRGLP